MYQKSPFPYLIVLVAIVGISCFTNLTIDKEIEEPIVHEIKNSNTNKIILASDEIEVQDYSSQLALQE